MASLRSAFLLGLLTYTAICTAQSMGEGNFEPLRQWQSAISRGDASVLGSLYSQNPPASIRSTGGALSAADDIAFWRALKGSTLKLDVQHSASPQSGIQQMVIEIEVRSPANGQAKKPPVYISAMQVWQKQAEQWKIVALERTDPARLQQPTSTAKQIYSETADAHEELKEVLERAAKRHTRVIVVFGANWCYDCHVLDKAFHRPELIPLIEKYYEVIHIDVGRGEKNQDIMQKYEVPVKRGIPGLAVLDSSGKLLYSQRNGEFEKTRLLGPQDLVEFFNKWKG